MITYEQHVEFGKMLKEMEKGLISYHDFENYEEFRRNTINAQEELIRLRFELETIMRATLKDEKEWKHRVY